VARRRSLAVLALQRPDLLLGAAEPLGGRLDLAAGRRDWLAGLAHDDLRELLLAGEQSVGDLVHPVGALGDRGLSHRRLGALGRRQRGVGLLGARGRHLREHAAVREVGDFEYVVGVAPVAVDVEALPTL